jgi:ribonuclease Z
MKSIGTRGLLLLLSFFVAGSVYAAGGVVKSPTGTAPDRYVYYPGTEELVKDEIRLIACGTGLPAARRDLLAG